MNIFKIFKDYRLFEIFALGIISGMPLPIIFSTLSFWLTEENIDIAIITTFAIARLPYSLKIFWSPIIDYFKVPVLARFGHRKSWLIFSSSITAVVLFCLSTTSPSISLSSIYILAIILGFSSATFDISFDALRIEKLEENMQALGGSSVMLGYRIGMLITGAGALGFAHWTNSWPQTFVAMSILFVISTIFIITVNEQKIIREKLTGLSFDSLEKMVFRPFKDFFTRKGSVIILLSIIFFKLGDAMLGIVSGPFYLKLGFDKGQIALAVKVFGVIATLAGAAAGGFVVYYLGNFKGLIVTGIAQSLTHFAFIWLNHQGPDFNSLLVAISIENFACGMGSTALVGYLSALCNKKYSATQYALLSSSATLFNNTITMYGGTLVKLLDWDVFFILTIIMALPGLAILVYLNSKAVN